MKTMQIVSTNLQVTFVELKIEHFCKYSKLDI